MEWSVKAWALRQARLVEVSFGEQRHGAAGEERYVGVCHGWSSMGMAGMVNAEYEIRRNSMYSWKPGARVRTDADTVGRICEEMAKDGRLTAENLVEDSRPVDAPLHGEFTWDDAKAAESWRKQEAMQIINHLEIRIKDVEPVRAFVKLTVADENYHPTEVIVRDANSRDIMLRNAYQELAAFKRKYNALSELAKVFEAIDMMEGRL